MVLKKDKNRGCEIKMDTYWNYEYDECVKCGRCVKACQEKSEYKHLYGGRDKSPHTYSDVLGCHCCEQYCKEVCYYDAIKITRW